MKKYNFLTILVIATGLVACNAGQKVDVVNTPIDDSSTIQLTTSKDLPPEVTAVCRDGSYSVAKDDTACLGHGGAIKVIKRYHAN
ncbi:hypothetical protein [Glaesserella sp.]|uniref:hypothetical protein n=1 Tax=Glaesserella sp. TaxID=2094731 RepID=UPI0035A1328E